MEQVRKYIKTDKNGSKHFEGYIPCERCSGTGWYTWGGTVNGVAMYGGTCYKCGGAGKVFSKWIERTPEYQAKLDAKRAEKHAKEQAEREAKRAEEAARKAKEEAERKAAEIARKAVSQYVGNVGDRLSITVTLTRVASYQAPSFSGYGIDTIHVYTFTDAQGNALVWKTSAALGKWSTDAQGLETFNAPAEGDTVTIKATVKAHGEYKGEKQTELQRVKLM